MKNSWALAFEEGVSRVSFSFYPGRKSGLSIKGVIGPGAGIKASFLHASLKINNVVPMSGCASKSLGM